MIIKKIKKKITNLKKKKTYILNFILKKLIKKLF